MGVTIKKLIMVDIQFLFCVIVIFIFGTLFGMFILHIYNLNTKKKPERVYSIYIKTEEFDVQYYGNIQDIRSFVFLKSQDKRFSVTHRGTSDDLVEEINNGNVVYFTSSNTIIKLGLRNSFISKSFD